MEGTPSAAVVWTGSSGQGVGANRGAAAVLDTNVERSNNWALLDSQQIAREAQASKERLAKGAQKRKNEESLNKQVQKMQLEPVFDKTQEYLAGMIQKQNEDLAGIAAQEENFLHPTSATQKKITEYAAKNKVLSVLDKDNKDYLDKMLVEVGNPDNVGEYDMEHFNKKINEYSELAKSSDDPVTAMSEFRNDPSNNPLRVNASIEDIVEDIPIEYGKDGKVDWDKTENLLTISLENPRKQDKVRSLILQKRAMDTEGVKEKAMEYMRLANADKLVKQTNNKTNKTDNGGDNSKNPKYTIGVDENNEPIEITFNHSRESPLTAELKDGNGNLGIYQIIAIKKNASGDWQILVNNTKGESVSLPFDGSIGNQNGTHNYEKFKELTGDDFAEGVYGGKKDGAAKPSGNKTKFVGVPQNGF